MQLKEWQRLKLNRERRLRKQAMMRRSWKVFAIMALSVIWLILSNA